MGFFQSVLRPAYLLNFSVGKGNEALSQEYATMALKFSLIQGNNYGDTDERRFRVLII